jgi:SulP family sulfate permease
MTVHHRAENSPTEEGNMRSQIEPCRPEPATSRRLWKLLHPKALLPALSAALVVAMIDIPFEISVAALVFAGDLSGHVSSGIGLYLFGSLVMAVVGALTSSFPGMVILPQEGPGAILALVAAAIMAGMSASATSQEAFLTVAAAISLTSMLTGAFFLVLGHRRLGALIRYIPYPVVGGFLAGTGWLLIHGAMGVMTGISLTSSRVVSLLQPDVLIRWFPGLLFALVTLILLRRHSHFLIIPGMLLVATALFYVVLWCTGTSMARASAQGWLLGTFSKGALWSPLTLSTLPQVHWAAVFGQAGSIGTILLISVISLLLSTSGLELSVRQDIDFNRELQSAGLANLVAGLGGAPVGFQTLTYSALGHRVGADSRLVGLLTGLLYAVMLLFGAPLLSYFPKPVLGGMLLFLGLAFLVEWLYDAWLKLSKAEYGIVLLILIAMDVAGVLVSVGLGIVLAVVLFVVNYSRIPVVKHTLSGTSYRSNVDRPRADTQALRSQGDWLYILELQGFIFFGTANMVLDQLRQRLNNPTLLCPRFIVLDFRQVSGLDASAVLSFAKMKQLAQARGLALVFTHLSSAVRHRLAQEVFTYEDKALWRVEVDLDHGVEWCEEQILRMLDHEETITGEGERPEDLQLEAIHDLRRHMERKDLPDGYCLIRQGDPPRGIYIVEAGQVTAQRECGDGQVMRLRKMGPGTVVGEMGLYLGSKASASIVTNQPSTVYYLSRASLAQLEEVEPRVAAAFHKYIAQLLSERVSFANDALQALLAESQPSLAGKPPLGQHLR